MAQHELPPITTSESTYAYEVSTHFLNQRGGHNHRFAWIDEPSLEAAAFSFVPPDKKSEVVWVNFNAHPRIKVDMDGDEQTLYGKRQPVGEIYLATMWQEGKYSFKTLDELITAPNLPTYTAAWLARYINGTGRKALGVAGLTPEFSDVEQKTPLAYLLSGDEIRKTFPEAKDDNLAKLRTKAITERSERLARRAIDEHPHLRDWYIEREIMKEEDVS